MHFTKTCALLLGTLLGPGAMLSPAQAALPQPLKADKLVALPEGGWLLQSKTMLRSIDAQGRPSAELALASEKLDVRRDGARTLAVLVERSQQRVQGLYLQAGQFRPAFTLPALGFPIESLCLYRDPQQLLHGFFIGEEGRGQQWLLSGPAPRLLRELALPTGVVDCQVDDARGELLLAEADFGVWSYPADAERKLRRTPVLLKQPYGPLQQGALSLARLPGGLAVLDGKGERAHLLAQTSAGWQARSSLRLPAGSAQLAIDARASQLWRQDEDSEQWQAQALRWSVPKLPVAAALPIVLPSGQTEPVARLGDAADDPAIWINPRDAAQSRVLGTNKKQGLLVYDLAGKETQLLAVGRLNNVDLRQQVRLGGQTLDLAVATHRDALALVLFGIDADGQVSERARIPSGLPDIYGVCLYQPPAGGLEAFVNDKDGRFQHYRIEYQDGQFSGRKLREFRLPSQPEGCVANDQDGVLFMGEEDRGIWTISARAELGAKPRLLMPVGAQLHADVEGMALYHGSAASYLVVSSQGNDSYLVLDAKPPFAVRGAFRVGIQAELGIDGASETDGLEVTSANLGGVYGQGMLVVQDGHKRLPDGAQNFKYIAWQDIARALALP